ncbi:hypothetical protein AW736_05345 [Termitidicoccus mucosus]|uniref:Uncharacterized protein n=1 Tax=Termitidicoccus mucosus TaxID=1184151 RepID=A0A178IP84_9BACT|nr:hypothetical protein AW736_05345 [Opitutaceae bacterium TSB47]
MEPIKRRCRNLNKSGEQDFIIGKIGRHRQPDLCLGIQHRPGGMAAMMKNAASCFWGGHTATGLHHKPDRCVSREMGILGIRDFWIGNPGMRALIEGKLRSRTQQAAFCLYENFIVGDRWARLRPQFNRSRSGKHNLDSFFHEYRKRIDRYSQVLLIT